MRKLFTYDAGAYSGVREDPNAAAAKLAEVLAHAPLGTGGIVRKAHLTNLHGGPYEYGQTVAQAFRDEVTGEVRWIQGLP